MGGEVGSKKKECIENWVGLMASEVLFLCRTLARNGNWTDGFGFMIISCFAFCAREAPSLWADKKEHIFLQFCAMHTSPLILFRIISSNFSSHHPCLICDQFLEPDT